MAFDLGALTLANELGLEVYEVNASDFRNAEQINQKVGSAVKQQSLFSKGKEVRRKKRNEQRS